VKLGKKQIAVLGFSALVAGLGFRAGAADDPQAAIEELRDQLGSMAAQVNDFKDKAEKGVNFGVNADLRYDYWKYNSFTAQNPTSYALNGNNWVKAGPTDGAPNAAVGMYAKRVEIEFKAKTASWAMWHLQFEFAALKLEDLGVELNNIDFLPMMDTGSWKWNMKIGQFRQPFGIEQQTGSSSTVFPERALMYGGASPFPAGVSSTASVSKLVTERVMGLHFWHEQSFGPVGYKAQFTVANDTSDQASGTNSLAGFPAQKTDQDPSEFGRLGVDLNFVPKWVKLNIGASAIHNSANSVFFSSSSTTQAWTDVAGADSTLELPFLNWKIWGEWVGSNSFGNNSLGYAGLKKRSEAWYVTSVMQPLKFFMKDPLMLDLNFRYENFVDNVDAANSLPAAAYPFQATAAQAISYGIKWSYVGKNYTSLNYTIYGINGDFTALAGTELLVLQQQFNF
jgi:hypothetical protein